MAIADTVKSYLEAQDIEYGLIGHPESHSSRESAAAARVPADHIAKGVILKGEAAEYLMAVVPASHWVRVHALCEELDRALELAPESEVLALFADCQPGAIPALGLAYGIETVMDETLMSLARVYFEAGDHEHLVVVDGEDFRQLLSGTRHWYFSHPDYE